MSLPFAVAQYVLQTAAAPLISAAVVPCCLGAAAVRLVCTRLGDGAATDERRLHHCVPASAEASRTLALARDVVAQAAVATLAVLAAVDAVLAEGTRLGTDGPLQSKQLAVTLGG